MDPVKMNINLEDTTEITCDECGSNVFHEAVVLRSISRFITGTAQDGMMPIPVFACDKCGHINEQFLPQPKTTSKSPSVEDVTEQPKRSRFPQPE
jgi:uncharacterized Zn finger protein